MAHWLRRSGSSSVYLRSPNCVSYDEDDDTHPDGHIGHAESDLDQSAPTEWLNDLVTDYVHQKSHGCSGAVLPGDKPLHDGDIAATERTLQMSSCVLVLSLLYAERLRTADCTIGTQDAACASTTWDTDDENFRDHPVAPAPTVDPDDVESAPETSDSNCRFSATELFLVCVLTANKYLYDEGEQESMRNTDLAPVARIKVRHLHELERIFLRCIDWRLHVTKDEFAAFLQRIERTLALRATRHAARGLHYQDVDRLWNIVVDQALTAIWVLLSVYAGIAAMYVCVALTISFGPLLFAQAPVAGQFSSVNLSLPVGDLSPFQLMPCGPGNTSAPHFKDVFTDYQVLSNNMQDLAARKRGVANLKQARADGSTHDDSVWQFNSFQQHVTVSQPVPTNCARGDYGVIEKQFSILYTVDTETLVR